jgi:hypothetical protein
MVPACKAAWLQLQPVPVRPQMHYTVLDGSQGLIDSSGFRLHTTTQLRPNDMGILVGSGQAGEGHTFSSASCGLRVAAVPQTLIARLQGGWGVTA